MKKLSLLMFAILILGCGTETTVVEEPVVEEPEPIVIQNESIAPPQIVGGNVLDGDVDADPELLNRDGITLQFSEPLSMYYVVFGRIGGRSPNWSPLDIVDDWDIGNQVHLMPMEDSRLLEYNTEYWLSIYAQGSACNAVNTKMKFRTKPR